MVALLPLATLLLAAGSADSGPARLLEGPPPEVYRLHLAVDIPVMAAGTSAALLRAYLVEHLVRKRCPCSADELGFLDRGTVGNHSQAAGLASDITVGVALIVPPLVDLLALGANRASAEDLTVLTETVLVSTLLQQAANFGLQRPRPRTYAGQQSYVRGGTGYLSFYAGHVSNTAAMLSAASFTMRQRHGEHVWPWVVTGLVTASVGAERVLAGQHFPTDVLTGALVGFGVGIAVPWLHARVPAAKLTLIPAPGGRGLALMGQF